MSSASERVSSIKWWLFYSICSLIKCVLLETNSKEYWTGSENVIGPLSEVTLLSLMAVLESGIGSVGAMPFAAAGLNVYEWELFRSHGLTLPEESVQVFAFV